MPWLLCYDFSEIPVMILIERQFFIYSIVYGCYGVHIFRKIECITYFFVCQFMTIYACFLMEKYALFSQMCINDINNVINSL